MGTRCLLRRGTLDPRRQQTLMNLSGVLDNLRKDAGGLSQVKLSGDFRISDGPTDQELQRLGKAIDRSPRARIAISLRVKSRPGKVTPMPLFTSPTITMRPPEATRSTVCSMALTLPVASMTTAAPSPLVCPQEGGEKLVVGWDSLCAKLSSNREAGGLDVSSNDSGTSMSRYFNQCQANWAAAQDEHILPRPDVSSPTGLHSNGYRLCKGRIRKRKAFRNGVDVGCRGGKVFRKSTRAVNPNDLQLNAAVGFTNPAGITGAAADEGFDDYWGRRCHIGDTFTCSLRDTRDLMTGYHRIVSIRILALIDIQIPGANPSSPYRNQYLARTRFGSRLGFKQHLKRATNDYGFYDRSLLMVVAGS